MVRHWGSSAGLYLADPTSPISSHCASIVVTSTLRVNWNCLAFVYGVDAARKIWLWKKEYGFFTGCCKSEKKYKWLVHWILQMNSLECYHWNMMKDHLNMFSVFNLLEWLVPGEPMWAVTLVKKATIHQVTTMLATSKNVLFPGHNHLLITGTDDLTL